jgi:hypothetical protein
MSEWISVRDRLPEKGRTVLVYCEGVIHEFLWRYFLAYVNAENRWCESFSGEKFMLKYSYSIKYWRPLPEPPRENDDE